MSLFENKPVAVTKNRKRRPRKLDLEHIWSEWREIAPVFCSLLLKSAGNKSSKSSTWFGSLALACSVLLKQRNSGMSAVASVLGVLLKSKAVKI